MVSNLQSPERACRPGWVEVRAPRAKSRKAGRRTQSMAWRRSLWRRGGTAESLWRDCRWWEGWKECRTRNNFKASKRGLKRQRPVREGDRDEWGAVRLEHRSANGKASSGPSQACLSALMPCREQNAVSIRLGASR